MSRFGPDALLAETMAPNLLVNSPGSACLSPASLSRAERVAVITALPPWM